MLILLLIMFFFSCIFQFFFSILYCITYTVYLILSSQIKTLNIINYLIFSHYSMFPSSILIFFSYPTILLLTSIYSSSKYAPQFYIYILYRKYTTSHQFHIFFYSINHYYTFHYIFEHLYLSQNILLNFIILNIILYLSSFLNYLQILSSYIVSYILYLFYNT